MMMPGLEMQRALGSKSMQPGSPGQLDEQDFGGSVKGHHWGESVGCSDGKKHCMSENLARLG